MEYFPLSFWAGVLAGASVRSVLGWLEEAAESLVYLHLLNMLHRDVKPSNFSKWPTDISADGRLTRKGH